MKFKSVNTVANCTVIEADRHFDNRGFLQELHHKDKYNSLPFDKIYKDPLIWEQVNWSNSKKDVLRGIHVAPYEKLVTCVSGKIFDVVVDLRTSSRTYLKWYGCLLSADIPSQVLVPANCGHAFLALEDATVIYCQTKTYGNKEWNIKWDDKDIGVMWPIASPILSLADMTAKTLAELHSVGL